MVNIGDVSSMKRVAVIIPTKNEALKIEALLRHLNNIRAKDDFRILVMDSPASEDNIQSKVLALKAEYHQSKQEGRAAQMHAGAQLCEEEILCFLHADVLPNTRFIQEIRSCLEAEYDFGYFSYRFDKDSLMLRMNAWFTKFDGFYTGGGDQILFILNERYKESGGFNPDQSFMEDYIFHKTLKKAGFNYKIIDKPSRVSARKYVSNPYWKVNMLNLYVLLAFKMGRDPRVLREIYQRNLSD